MDQFLRGERLQSTMSNPAGFPISHQVQMANCIWGMPIRRWLPTIWPNRDEEGGFCCVLKTWMGVRARDEFIDQIYDDLCLAWPYLGKNAGLEAIATYEQLRQGAGSSSEQLDLLCFPVLPAAVRYAEH